MEETNVAEEVIPTATENGDNESPEKSEYDENKLMYTKNEFLYAYVELILLEKGLGEDHDVPLCSNKFKFPELVNSMNKMDNEDNNLGGDDAEDEHNNNNNKNIDYEDESCNNKSQRNYSEKGGGAGGGGGGGGSGVASSSFNFHNNDHDRGRIRNDFFNRDNNNSLNKNNLEGSINSNNPLNSINKRNSNFLKNNKFNKFFDGNNSNTSKSLQNNSNNNNVYGNGKNQFDSDLGVINTSGNTNRNSFSRKTNFYADGNTTSFMNANNNANIGIGNNNSGNKSLWRDYDKSISSWRSSKGNNKLNENLRNDQNTRGAKGINKGFMDNMKNFSTTTPRDSDVENESNNDNVRNVNRNMMTYPKERGGGGGEDGGGSAVNIKRGDNFSDNFFANKNMNNMSSNIGHPSTGNRTNNMNRSNNGAYNYTMNLNSMGTVGGRLTTDNNDAVGDTSGMVDNNSKKTMNNNSNMLNNANNANKNFNFTTPSSAFFDVKGGGNVSGTKKGSIEPYTNNGISETVEGTTFQMSNKGFNNGSLNINGTGTNAIASDDWKIKKYKKFSISGNSSDIHGVNSNSNNSGSNSGINNDKLQNSYRMTEEKFKRGDSRNDYAHIFMNKSNESNNMNIYSMNHLHEKNIYNKGGNNNNNLSIASGGVQAIMSNNVKSNRGINRRNTDIINNELKGGREKYTMEEMNKNETNENSHMQLNTMGKKMGKIGGAGGGGGGNNFLSGSFEMVRNQPGHFTNNNNVNTNNSSSGMNNAIFNGTNRSVKVNQNRESKNVMKDDWSNIRKKPNFVDNKKATDDFMWHKMSEQFDKNNKMSFESLHIKLDPRITSSTLGKNRNNENSNNTIKTVNSYDVENTAELKNDRKDDLSVKDATENRSYNSNTIGIGINAFPTQKGKKMNESSFKNMNFNNGNLKSNEQQKIMSKLHLSGENHMHDGNYQAERKIKDENGIKNEKGRVESASSNKVNSEKSKKKKKKKNEKDKDKEKEKEKDCKTHRDIKEAEGKEDQKKQMKSSVENIHKNPVETSNDNNISNTLHEGNNATLHESSSYKFYLNEKLFLHKNNINRNKNLNEKKEFIFNKLYDTDKINLQGEHRGIIVGQNYHENDARRDPNQFYRFDGINAVQSRTGQLRSGHSQADHTFNSLSSQSNNHLGKMDKRNVFDSYKNIKPNHQFVHGDNLNEKYFISSRYTKHDPFRSRRISEDRDSVLTNIPQESLLQKIKNKNVNADNTSSIQSSVKSDTPIGININSSSNNYAIDGVLYPNQKCSKEHDEIFPVSQVNKHINPNQLINNRSGNLGNSPNCMNESVTNSNLANLFSSMNAEGGGVSVMRPVSTTSKKNNQYSLPSKNNQSNSTTFANIMKGRYTANVESSQMNNLKHIPQYDNNRCNDALLMDKDQLANEEKKNFIFKKIMNKIKIDENLYNKVSENEKEELLKQLFLNNQKLVDSCGYYLLHDEDDTSDILSMQKKQHLYVGTHANIEETHLNLQSSTTSNIGFFKHVYNNSGVNVNSRKRSNISTPFGNNKMNVNHEIPPCHITSDTNDNYEDENKYNSNMQNKMNCIRKNDTCSSFSQEIKHNKVVEYPHHPFDGGNRRLLLREEEIEKKGVQKCDHIDINVDDKTGPIMDTHQNNQSDALKNEQNSIMKVSSWLRFFSTGKKNDKTDSSNVVAKEENVIQTKEANHMHDENSDICTSAPMSKYKTSLDKIAMHLRKNDAVGGVGANIGAGAGAGAGADADADADAGADAIGVAYTNVDDKQKMMTSRINRISDMGNTNNDVQIANGFCYNNTEDIVTCSNIARTNCNNNSNVNYIGDSSNHLHDEGKMTRKYLSNIQEGKKSQTHEGMDNNKSYPHNENISNGCSTSSNIPLGHNLVDDHARKFLNETTEDVHNNVANNSSNNNTHTTNMDLSKNPYIHIMNRINKIKGDVWQYKDPAGNVQGPFSSELMFYWWSLNYFPYDLPIRFNKNMPWVNFNEIFPPGSFPFVFPLSSFSKNNYNNVKNENEFVHTQQNINDLSNHLEGVKNRISLESHHIEKNSLGISTSQMTSGKNNSAHNNSIGSDNQINNSMIHKENLEPNRYNQDVSIKNATMTGGNVLYNNKECAENIEEKKKGELKALMSIIREKRAQKGRINSSSSNSDSNKEINDLEKYLISNDDFDENTKSILRTIQLKEIIKNSKMFKGEQNVFSTSSSSDINVQKCNANYKGVEEGKGILDIPFNNSSSSNIHIKYPRITTDLQEMKFPKSGLGGGVGRHCIPYETIDNENPYSKKVFVVHDEEQKSLPKIPMYTYNGINGRNIFPHGTTSEQMDNKYSEPNNQNYKTGMVEESINNLLDTNNLSNNGKHNNDDKDMKKFMNSQVISSNAQVQQKGGGENNLLIDKINMPSKNNNNMTMSDDIISISKRLNTNQSIVHDEDKNEDRRKNVKASTKAPKVPKLSDEENRKQAKEVNAITQEQEQHNSDDDDDEGYSTVKKDKKGKKLKRESVEKKGIKVNESGQLKERNEKKATNKSNEGGKSKEKNYHLAEKQINAKSNSPNDTNTEVQMNGMMNSLTGHKEETKKKGKEYENRDQSKITAGIREKEKKNNIKKKKKESTETIKSNDFLMEQPSDDEKQQQHEKKTKKEVKKDDSHHAVEVQREETQLKEKQREKNDVSHLVNTANQQSEGKKKTEKMKWSITGERKIDKLVDIMKGEEKSINMKIKIENTKKKIAASSNINNANGPNGKKCGWNVSHNDNIKNSDNVNFPDLTTGVGGKQSKVKTTTKALTPNKTITTNNDKTKNMTTANGGAVCSGSGNYTNSLITIENNDIRSSKGKKNTNIINNQNPSEKKKWKSEGIDINTNEEDKKFPPLLNSASVKVENIKKKMNTSAQRELTDLKQLSSSCKIPLDDSVLNFLKNFKKAEEIYAFLQHSVEDKNKLNQFAKEFIKINNKNDENSKTPKKKKKQLSVEKIIPN
ncbi:hypothetical protein, conserved [Plasmodium gonderi]|uniref:GYF domain-containing protein n=1 Tax=Plasmodium gonderi TaxID=77519 RepID=A0A1Y1JKJ2_PLAGO|nr:hypothetical protein, conserved [Plasmodium gonderi]GAW81975.1 hypothetical protein, conserved [Plasmodium gonderi]